MLSSPPVQTALEVLKALAIAFSAVALVTVQFLRNSLPAPHILLVPSVLMVKTVLLFVVLPSLILLVIDRLIAWRFSERGLFFFRSALMAGALVIVLRQLQLFWDPTERLAEQIQEFAPLIFPLLFLAICGLFVIVVVRFHGVASSFFLYFAPAAVLLVAIMPFEDNRQHRKFSQYDDQEVTRPDADSPPVYIIVFDELSYEALLGPDGQIDAAVLPNFARLAAEGMHVTNATTNQFYTWLVVPELIDSILSLSGEYEVRLYEQAERIEGHFSPLCGSEITCRGVRHLTLNQGSLSLDLGARAFYALLPDRVQSLTRPVLHPLLRAAGVVPPPADPLGLHMVSRDLLSLYLSDITASDAPGRISFIHSLLPHHPLIFAADGDFSSDEYRRLTFLQFDAADGVFDARWIQYRDQIAYVDAFIGDLLDRLEQEGLLDVATVIVTADHGMRLHFPFDSNPIFVDSLVTRIPMFILSPGAMPGASDVDYQHVDFAASLYELLGLDPSAAPVSNTSLAAGPGVSILAEERPERSKTFLVYDYRNQPHFWRYSFNAETAEWTLLDDIGWLLGDRTLGGIQVGDPDLPR